MTKSVVKEKLQKGEIQIHFDDYSKLELLRELMGGFSGIEGTCEYYIKTSDDYDLQESEPFRDRTIIKISEITEDEEETNNIEVVSEEVLTIPEKEDSAIYYDFINPNHYKKFSVETIDMMVAIWDKEATAIHCEMSAFGYRMRMGEKPDQPIERDLEKVNWYLNKAKELRS